ncbi:MAG: response regulator transcription factor [Acidobacteria bacterium]|nr:response regulator transcription factor [Acidobacteriota bacterium]MDA1236937.1 response regulator transcription factor [Acidobacteriota bacterium]
MAKTILAIEDDTDLCELLEYNLTRGGYEVKILHGLEGALDTVKAIRPDLLILDVMLPDGDGLDFCRTLKADPEVRQTPVLFLTARSQEIDRVLGLEIGGDDYVTKPFSPRELLARVKVHLRRAGGDRAMDLPTEAGPISLDKVSRRVSLNGEALALTATEFKLLEFFLAHPGRVYSREQLLNSIWGEGTHVTPRNVDVHIRRLREQIETQPDSPQWLQTVRGFGYRFEVPT